MHTLWRDDESEPTVEKEIRFPTTGQQEIRHAVLYRV
jgi:hypothetical protein